jgi:protocatechuate 3,4-dioxygenase beta subunit
MPTHAAAAPSTDIPEQHDLGLQADLAALLRQQASRRYALRWLGGAAGLSLVGCGGGGGDDSTETASSTSGDTNTTTTTGSCSVIPEETAGPYPGDGSNSNSSGTVNVLTQSGIVRSDMRSSFGSAGSNVAAGIAMTMTLQLVNTNASCASLAGYAIYLWHCTRDGLYSLYSSSVISENYLRAVQVTDSEGKVTFTTIVPGCYSGRMPHMHFEVYPSLASATGAANKIKTSQIAFPLSFLNTAYTATGYSSSVTNLANISFASDNIFSDGYSTQLATVSGSNSAGYAATLEVGVAV